MNVRRVVGLGSFLVLLVAFVATSEPRLTGDGPEYVAQALRLSAFHPVVALRRDTAANVRLEALSQRGKEGAEPSQPLAFWLVKGCKPTDRYS